MKKALILINLKKGRDLCRTLYINSFGLSSQAKDRPNNVREGVGAKSRRDINSSLGVIRIQVS